VPRLQHRASLTRPVLARNDRSIPEPDGFNYVVAYRGHLIVREQSGLEPKLQPVVKRLQTIIDSRR
jgi:hypothetical protein